MISPANLQRGLCLKVYFQSEYSPLSLAKLPENYQKVNTAVDFG